MTARWISSLAVVFVLSSAGAAVWGQVASERDPAPRIGATIRRDSDGAPSGSLDDRTASNTEPGAAANGASGNTTRGGPGLEPLRRPARTSPSPSATTTSTTTPAREEDPYTRPTTPLKPVERGQPPAEVKVTTGDGTIPNRHGQVWREYDITAYTQSVTSTKRPEQAIVDWILHDTGYEVWHGETVAMLSADLKSVRVYHTPDVQQTVGEIVERFVTRPVDSHAIGLRVMTVGGPDWRARAQRLMTPITAETPGVSAWLMRPEDAALVLGDLAKRSDFREHTAPQLAGLNGQALDVVATRPRQYVQGIAMTAATGAATQNIGAVNEGLSLSMLPLLSKDGKDIDAILRCTIDQVEKLQPVVLESQGIGARNRTQIEVPQVAEFRLHERFRWPTDQVLLVSAGMIPSPTPAAVRPIPLPIQTAPRVELLIAIDARMQVSPAGGAPAANLPANGQYRGRY